MAPGGTLVQTSYRGRLVPVPRRTPLGPAGLRGLTAGLVHRRSDGGRGRWGVEAKKKRPLALSWQWVRYVELARCEPIFHATGLALIVTVMNVRTAFFSQGWTSFCGDGGSRKSGQKHEGRQPPAQIFTPPQMPAFTHTGECAPLRTPPFHTHPPRWGGTTTRAPRPSSSSQSAPARTAPGRPCGRGARGWKEGGKHRLRTRIRSQNASSPNTNEKYHLTNLGREKSIGE